jgi:hypothetical protein
MLLHNFTDMFPTVVFSRCDYDYRIDVPMGMPSC